MKYSIRQLKNKDYDLLSSVNTGIDDDYVVRIYEKLITGDNFLYGLFVDNSLVCFGGYSVYNKVYAMLGRLRSDIRFRNNNYATKLMLYIIDQAFQNSNIKWVGANTEEDNIPAQRVLQKLGLIPHPPLYVATTKDTTVLTSGAKIWSKINTLTEKKAWLKKSFILTNSLFPYECYYPFPASWDLFKDNQIAKWNFYENEDKTRFLITKPDQKGHLYLHVIYPWNDIMNQCGLWETISQDYRKLSKHYSHENTYIWIDLTKKQVSILPKGHSFQLASPWILYGIHKSNWKKAE